MSDDTFLIFDRALQEEKDWWIKTLAPIQARTEIRPDAEPETARSHQEPLAEVTIGMPEGMMAKLHDLCGGSDAGIFAAYWVATSECLRRMNPENQVVIGSPTLSEPAQKVAENVIAVPTVDDLGNGTFNSLLAAQQVILDDAQARRRYPFLRLMNDLGHPPPPAPNPLFGVALASAKLHDSIPPMGQDVTILITSGEGAELKVDYLATKYTEHTVARFAQYVLQLLTNAMAAPDTPLRDLRLVDEAEEQRLLKGWDASAPVKPGAYPTAGDQSGLTHNQMLVWLADRLSPDAPLHNMVTLTVVEDALNPVAFNAAWDAVVAGTDALRTVVQVENGLPRAVIRDRVLGSLAQIDLGGVATDQDLEAWAQDRLAQPLDTSRSCFDCVVVTLGPDRWAWYLNLHHIVTDGVSNALLLSRVGALYAQARAEPEQTPPDWPEFSEFVASDWRARASKAGRKSHAYWAEYLNPPPPAPKWFGRQSRRTGTRLERQTLRLAPEITARLLARIEDPPFAFLNANLSMMVALLTATQAVVHRLSGENDLSVGVIFHNRRPATSDIAGLVMQVAPVRTKISVKDAFADIADRTVTEIRRILPHGSYATGNPGGRQNYDVLFNFLTTPLAGLPGVASRSFSVPSGHGHEALSIDARLSGGELIIDLDMHMEVFQPDERHALADIFLNAVTAIADNPRQSIEPATAQDPPDVSPPRLSSGGATVFDLFRAQAARTPTAIAAEAPGAQVTFHDLLRHAETIARDLEGRGPVAGRVVALCAERSPNFLAGVLGILASGATCLMLDPSEPQVWCDDIARRSDPVCTLYEDDLKPRDGPAVEWAGRAIQPEQIAFIFFTSGSTGAPKSVDMRHGALARYAQSAVDMFDLVPGDRLLQFARQTGDTFCEEIFSALAAGATLVFGGAPTISAPNAFLQEVHAARATVLDLPTAYWHELADGAADGSQPFLETVRLVVLGGDKVEPGRLQAWRNKLGTGHKLLNTYGPTEATIVSTSHALKPGTSSADVPIGRPIRDVSAYVLDPGLRPCPIGVPGELYIGGKNLARGYSGAPRLTAARFLPDPFAGEAGARMYQTGDLCYWRADGTLAFLSRIDRQVKLLGQRVEPAQVREHLLALGQFRDVEVVAIARPLRLAAYVVPAQETAPDWDIALRKKLLSHYPAHLVPSVFVAVPQITRDGRGRIVDDLPPVPADNDPPDTAKSRPLTPEETLMAQIWSDVLDVGQVGVDDNFFDLGGHSLLAARTMARVLEVFGTEHPLRVLFDYPDLAEFTAVVAARASMDETDT